MAIFEMRFRIICGFFEDSDRQPNPTRATWQGKSSRNSLPGRLSHVRILPSGRQSGCRSDLAVGRGADGCSL